MSKEELEMLIFQIDLMLSDDVGILFTTPEEKQMELFLIFVIVGIAIFVGTSLAAVLFLLQENNRLGEELEKNQPPF